MKAHRKQPLYLAFLLHRVSGLGLALFLPFHFYVLGLSRRVRQHSTGFYTGVKCRW
jgi:fumarate reductase subunit D